MTNGGLQQFERCPRCRKAWELFSVYRCPSCGVAFCAACEQEDPGSRDLRWLTSAAAETAVSRCPACTASITDVDKIGLIAGRDARLKQKEEDP